jgi:uncharacterized protein YjbI with pentapeptide repeats
MSRPRSGERIVPLKSNEVMTSLPQRVAVIVSPVARAARTTRVALQPTRRKLLVSMAATVTGATILMPWSWWRDGAQLVARPGWWWMPVLLLAAGLAGLAQLTARWWSRSGNDRQRPVAVRAPLFVHVGVLLLIAVAVAAAAGVGMWLAFGRPHLSVPGTATPAGTAPGGATGWSVQNTFDAMKIVLSVVAGIGGVVALTVGYRKQGHNEAAEHRENTKLFNDRFGKAADELGSDKAAVRLAGVYAMAGLADDWAGGRQTCIDVLCAYLRMPYTPPPAPADIPPSATTAPTELPLHTGVRPDDGDAHQERQVRHTVLDLLREHLLPAGTDGRPRWHGHRFNLNGAVFDGGDLSRIDVTAGTFLNLRAAKFSGGTVTFSDAQFSGGTVTFGYAQFSGGTVNLGHAEFSGGAVDFTYAKFCGVLVNFGDAKFSGGMVDFSGAEFSDGMVNFDHARFSGGMVNFSGAGFSGGIVNLSGAEFSDGMVTFRSARFAGGMVNFSGAGFSGSAVSFRGAGFSSGTVTFNSAGFFSGTIDFTYAKFSGGTVYFIYAKFSGGTVNFRNAGFSGGTVNFLSVEFSGGTVDFASPRDWEMPPGGVDGSEPGVQWPSPERLAELSSAKLPN